MKNKHIHGNSRNRPKAHREPKAKTQRVAENTHSNEGAREIADETPEQKIIRRAYELAPEWKISVIAKRKFLSLPSELQDSRGKEVCVKAVLNAHKELIPDPTRYWIWLIDETSKLTRVWDFQETCEAAGLNSLTVAQHLILEGKQVCNAIRMEGLAAYGSNIRMFVVPLFEDEFKLFGDKLPKSQPEKNESGDE